MVEFNGMSDNASSMMKQFQKMQKQMGEQAKAFESKELKATAGGGAVRVTVIGGWEVSRITLGKDAVDPGDVGMFEDLIKAAVNEAFRMVETENQQMMDKLTGGLPF